MKFLAVFVICIALCIAQECRPGSTDTSTCPLCSDVCNSASSTGVPLSETYCVDGDVNGAGTTGNVRACITCDVDVSPNDCFRYEECRASTACPIRCSECPANAAGTQCLRISADLNTGVERVVLDHCVMEAIDCTVLRDCYEHPTLCAGACPPRCDSGLCATTAGATVGECTRKITTVDSTNTVVETYEVNDCDTSNTVVCSPDNVDACLNDPNCAVKCPRPCSIACSDTNAEVCLETRADAAGSVTHYFSACHASCPTTEADYAAGSPCSLPEYGCPHPVTNRPCFCDADGNIHCEEPVTVLDSCSECPTVPEGTTATEDQKCHGPNGEVCSCRDGSCFNVGEEFCDDNARIILETRLRAFEENTANTGAEFTLSCTKDCLGVFGKNCFCRDDGLYHCEPIHEGPRTCAFDSLVDGDFRPCDRSFIPCYLNGDVSKAQCFCDFNVDTAASATTDPNGDYRLTGQVVCPVIDTGVPLCPPVMGECGTTTEPGTDAGMIYDIPHRFCRRSDSQICSCEREFDEVATPIEDILTVDCREITVTNGKCTAIPGWTLDSHYIIYNDKRYKIRCLGETVTSSGTTAKLACGCDDSDNYVCEAAVNLVVPVPKNAPKWRCPVDETPVPICPMNSDLHGSECRTTDRECRFGTTSADERYCYCEGGANRDTGDRELKWNCPEVRPEPTCPSGCCATFAASDETEDRRRCEEDVTDDDWGVDHVVRLELVFTLAAGETLPDSIAGEIITFCILREAEAHFSVRTDASGRKVVKITVLIDRATLERLYSRPSDTTDHPNEEDRDKAIAERARLDFAAGASSTMEARGVTVENTESNYYVSETYSSATSSGAIFTALLGTLLIALF